MPRRLKNREAAVQQKALTLCQSTVYQAPRIGAASLEGPSQEWHEQPGRGEKPLKRVEVGQAQLYTPLKRGVNEIRLPVLESAPRSSVVRVIGRQAEWVAAKEDKDTARRSCGQSERTDQWGAELRRRDPPVRQALRRLTGQAEDAEKRSRYGRLSRCTQW